jgi:hypothetical protein
MLSLMLSAVFAVTATVASAATENFVVSAEIPAATGITFTVFEIVGGQFPESPNATTDLDFDLTFNSELGVYFPTSFYAIDVGTSGGAGTPDVQFAYANTNNPNAAAGGNGLGSKGTITVVRAADPETPEVILEQATLSNINGVSVPFTDIAGGFLRSYVGLASGDPNTDPAGAEPFTNADAPGTYEGVLTITATVN